jgi:hypothetical protein
MNKPQLKSATDFFDGGLPATSYAIRRDDGPNTNFLTQVTETST